MTFPTQLYRDYVINHEIRIPINQPGFNGKSAKVFFFSWLRSEISNINPLEHTKNDPSTNSLSWANSFQIPIICMIIQGFREETSLTKKSPLIWGNSQLPGGFFWSLVNGPRFMVEDQLPRTPWTHQMTVRVVVFFVGVSPGWLETGKIPGDIYTNLYVTTRKYRVFFKGI